MRSRQISSITSYSDISEEIYGSDIVSLHVPETPATHGMIGEAELRSMKRGAYLINNSRGTVVDLDALSRAVRDGHLAGATLDVFPPSRRQIRNASKVPFRAWKM
jgi:D-3-phosphoglycerate dehydrogenase / 2-oxoglutarate reductase